MPHDAFRATGRALENEFFAKRDAERLAALRKEIATRAERRGLADVTGIPDEKVLQQLVDLGVTAENLAAVAIVPLVLVAWADGELDEKERTAVLQAAASHDVEEGQAAHQLLQTWLAAKPDDSLRDAWLAYAAAFRDELPKEVVVALHEWVMTRAKAVAEAAGGFLGLGSISGSEQRMLDELDEAFERS